MPILPRATVKEDIKLDNLTSKINLKTSHDLLKTGTVPINNKPMKLNDPYFYKNISGNPLKNEHYYASKRQA